MQSRNLTQKFAGEILSELAAGSYLEHSLHATLPLIPGRRAPNK